MPTIHLSLAHLTVMPCGPLELLDAAAAGGFDAVGLRIVPPTPTDVIVPVAGDEAMIRAILERLDATGLRVHDVEAVWLTPKTNIATLAPALETGARLGAGHLLVVGDDPDASRCHDNFARLCELARAHCLSISLEPMSYVALNTVSAALAMLREVAQPNAGLLVDALHLWRSGGSPADLRDIAADLLPYMHLCDATLASPPPQGLRPEGRSRRFYPGEGNLPLGDFLAAFPLGTPIAIEAPCARDVGLPATEKGRLCGEATRAFLELSA
ncbi:sugar phosphate isomerase/epimerase family protein [Muricoccus vinaceus]|uniref:Sugar phosphate isomerase/epimerase family protein n=1 Tax=Muricoccus vinaceus TaxID=424704 RepID=A0ABV6IT54_9PROT